MMKPAPNLLLEDQGNHEGDDDRGVCNCCNAQDLHVTLADEHATPLSLRRCGHRSQQPQSADGCSRTLLPAGQSVHLS